MIKSIRHKGLRLFYEHEDASKLQPNHIDKIRDILTRLEFAVTLDDVNVPGSRLHPLTGDMKGFWSVKVDKNYRVIFRFESGHVEDVDYLDYH